jgi:hypothetical protein
MPVALVKPFLLVKFRFVLGSGSGQVTDCADRIDGIVSVPAKQEFLRA